MDKKESDKEMPSAVLAAWLEKIARVHFQEMELGLARIKQVADKLDLLTFTSPIITIGGTNGKGSTVAALEAIYLAAGNRVGTFTSPFLFKINEQIKINGHPVTDTRLINAFEKIEEVRAGISLTPFEFHTLAALYIFKAERLEVIVLEVGLGGRLDAVNILDADVAIITSIDLDHTDILGASREAIAHEKIGIAKANQLLVCGEVNPPQNLIDYANQLPVKKAYYYSQDFFYQKNIDHWHWFSPCLSIAYTHLPYSGLKIQNMATACMTIAALQPRLPITIPHIRLGLSQLHLPARVQMIGNQIVDVAHNPAAMTHLANSLMELKIQQTSNKRYLAVFSMLADKDIVNSLLAIAPLIDKWYVAPLSVKRAANQSQLRLAFERANIQSVVFLPNIPTAYEMASNEAGVEDQVVIFGSFHTVSEAFSANSAFNALAQPSTSCTRI